MKPEVTREHARERRALLRHRRRRRADRGGPHRDTGLLGLSSRRRLSRWRRPCRCWVLRVRGVRRARRLQPAPEGRSAQGVPPVRRLRADADRGAVVIDNLPTLCILGLFVLVGFGLLQLREFGSPEKKWNRRYRAQRRELARLRKRGTP